MWRSVVRADNAIDAEVRMNEDGEGGTQKMKRITKIDTIVQHLHMSNWLINEKFCDLSAQQI